MLLNRWTKFLTLKYKAITMNLKGTGSRGRGMGKEKAK